MKKLFIILTVAFSVMLIAASCFAAVDEGRGPGDHQAELTDRPAIYYEAYIHGQGWTNRCREMESAGDAYGGQTIDAISISVDINRYLKVVYRVHSTNGQWSPWVSNGAVAGTPGTAIDGIELGFAGQAAMYYDLSCKVLSGERQWTDWTKPGSTAGNLQQPIQAIRIKVE